MAHVQVTPDQLVVTLQGKNRLLGRWSPLTVPWGHVSRAYADEATARSHPGMRWGVASHIPGILTVGSYRRAGRRDFWDVSDPRNGIVVELTAGKYDRLIIEVDDPAAVVAAINREINRG